MRSILGIDTASADGSGALWIDGRVAGTFPLRAGQHSSGLSAAVRALLEDHSIPIARLSAVAVAGGPGSFTGLRIGLAWAKGLALAAGTPLALISSHEAAAHAHRARGGLVATLLPGERGRVEIALWEVGGSGTAARFGPESVPDTAWLERLQGAAGGIKFALYASLPSGTAGRALEQEIGEEAEDAGIDRLPNVPLGPAVAELGARALESGGLADPVDSTPDYGRAPNARKPVR